VDNVSIAQFYAEPAPPVQVCGDILPGTWGPVVQFTFRRAQTPLYKRLRWRFRHEQGPVSDYASAAVPVVYEWEGLGQGAYVDFEQYDLWAVTVNFTSEPTGLVGFDADSSARMAAQYWAQIPPPGGHSGFAKDSGYSTAGPRVQLGWVNGHGGGAQYQTRVEEGASPGSPLDSVLEYVVSYVTAPGATGVTRRFWLRHFSHPAPRYVFELTNPASAPAGPVDVYVPPRLAAAIAGPDGIGESGQYTWDATPSGGTPAYHFRWYFQEGGCCGFPIESVGGDSRYLTLTIQQRETFWFFRLIVTESDSYTPKPYWADSLSELIVFVDAAGWGFGAPAAALAPDSAAPLAGPERPIERHRGLIDVDGVCHAIPEDREERQPMFRRLWQHEDVSACWVEVTGRDVPGA
jgi:diadenosine tetraphosphatase ApaH/serine/threonine PP2A family protein phosphatase